MRLKRVAVWGLGQHAITKILPAISMVEGLDLYGVCSRNSDVVYSVAKEWNCLGWSTPELMLEDSEVDVVYLATPIGLHFSQGTQVLNANKHLWCEKPLSCSLEDSAQLLEIAKNKSLSVCEGHMFIHHPHFQRLRQYIKDATLGKILAVDCMFGIPELLNGGFRSDPGLGGGAFFDVGCYPVAAVLELFLEDSFQLTYVRPFGREMGGIDTSGSAVVEFSSGVVANLSWRINCAYKNEINIWGEKGSLATRKIFSKPSDYVPIFSLDDIYGISTSVNSLSGNHFRLMLQDFLATITDVEKSKSHQNSILRRAILMNQISSRENNSEII